LDARHEGARRPVAAVAEKQCGSVVEQRPLPDRHERDLEFLARSATEFVDLASDADIMAFTARRLSELVAEALVMIGEFDPATGCMRGRAICGPPEVLGRFEEIDPGFFGASVPIVEPALAALMTGRFVEVPGGLELVMTGRVLPEKTRVLEASIGFRRSLTMGFTLHGELFGGLLLIEREGADLPDPRIIEAFVNQATVALQRRRAEEDLRESERHFRDLADQLPQSVVETDVDGNITFANRNVLKATGLTDVDAIRGRNIFDTYLSTDRERVAASKQRMLAGQTLLGEEFTGLRPNGTVYHVAVYASPIERGGQMIGVRSIAIDITERKRAEAARQRYEARLQHAEKLESLAVLAGGLAHDYNNLLVAILGNAELALTGLKPGTSAHERVHKIRNAARRAAELTDQLLDCSGRRHFALRTFALNDIVEEMCASLGGVLGRADRLHLELAPTLPAIEGDTGQVRQVLSNLLTNAADAVEGRNGTVTVRTGVVRGDDPALRDAYLGSELLPEDYVFVEVADTGCGMDEATRARVFDPFFTTKFPGRGLGLAAVLGIVRTHRGAIRVESEVDRGTTFGVLFRVAEGAAANAR
jgi:PAS domain S-box-containing protein